MNFYKLPFILRSEGISGIWRRVITRICGNPYLSEYQRSYDRWTKIYGIETINTDKLREESKKYKYEPLISILTPIYNTNHSDLRACLDSVSSQAYQNWELILVDDNSSDPEIWPLLQRYASSDPRIKIKHRVTNGHICVASNDALAMATGEWIALLDHDDVLWPNALYEVVKRINEKPNTLFVYSDEDKIAENGRTHCDPFFKPDWSPHFLRSINYITHFSVIKKNLIDKIGSFSAGTEGAQDWDLFLRATRELEKSSHCHTWDDSCPIQHIDTILYSWRKSATSTSSTKHAFKAKSYAYDAQRLVLQNDLDIRGGGDVRNTKYIGVWAVQPKLKEKPLISIIIPTKDNLKFLIPCLFSIQQLSTYSNFEIVIVDTGSVLPKTWQFYEENTLKVSVINYTEPLFNYSKAVNLGTSAAKGKYLLFLNDDTTIQTADWLEQMLSFAQLADIGAVGCRLLYPNGRIQHTGLVLGHEDGEVLGEKGFVSNYFRTVDPLKNYDISTLSIDTIRDYSAVTAACLMIDATKHREIGGFDESFAIAFNDVDYCLKLLEKKYYNILVPDVVITHHESVSVGRPEHGERDLRLFSSEIRRMKSRWMQRVSRDAFFSSQLQLLNGMPYCKIK